MNDEKLNEIVKSGLHVVRGAIQMSDPEDRIRIINWLMEGFCMEYGKVVPEGQGECFCMRED